MSKTHLYRHFDAAGNLLYVGISLSALQRLSQHKSISSWFDNIASVTIESFESREQAIEAEVSAIQNEKPKHNVMHNGELSTLVDENTPWLRANKSRMMITERVVNFKPLYSIPAASEVLELSTQKIKALIADNKIGHIKMGERAGNPVIKITGWQLIDFLESLEGDL